MIEINWFITIPIIWYLCFIYAISSGTIISDTSKVLGNIIYYIIPLILLFFPAIRQRVFKKNFLKSILIGTCFVIIYVIIFFVLSYGLERYFSIFSEYKWKNYAKNRDLMIEDLNHKYEIVGMSKEDIVNLLGKGYSVTGKNDEQLYYYFIKEVDDYTLYYYLIFMI